MAKNGKAGDGQVKDRSQVLNPKTNQWVKRDTETEKFIDINQNGEPHKGVRREKNKLKIVQLGVTIIIQNQK